MRGWTYGITLAAAALACGPQGDSPSSSLLQQGRQYTAWLYGSQYEKLWNRFSPDMRQTFGSVSDLASFAGQAVTRLGREQGQVDEKVETASPLRIYSRTSTFDRSRHKMLLEWTMAEDGAVTGLVLRPALDGEARWLVHSSAQRDLSLHREQHHLTRLARQAQHQHLGQESRDVAAAEVHRGHDQAPHQILHPVEGAQLRARRFLAQRPEVDPQLVGRLPRPLVGLGAQDSTDPQVQGLERLDRVHAITASASISISMSAEMSRRTSTMLVAGRIAPNTSPCARANSSQREMSVTYIRVRTTSASEAPARCSAASMFLQGLGRLGIGVAGADDLAVGARRGGAGHVHGVADPDGAGVADDRLPGRAAGDELSVHAQALGSVTGRWGGVGTGRG